MTPCNACVHQSHCRSRLQVLVPKILGNPSTYPIGWASVTGPVPLPKCALCFYRTLLLAVLMHGATRNVWGRSCGETEERQSACWETGV